MKILAIAIRHLIACGASLDAVAMFVEEIENVPDISGQIVDLKTYERQRKRAYRERIVPDNVPDKRKKEPKKENIIYNNITPLEGESEGKPLSRKLSPEGILFQAFWDVFPRKVAKGTAARAFKNALRRSPAEPIIAGASRYAASKPDPKFTKHPATWLNADCWLDEPDKPKNNVHAGPWKPVEPEPDHPKISDEERQANLEKLARIRFKPKGI